jgi:Kef-type K+ transport system membrane component KefB
MLHAYITSYAICFMATVVIIMLLLIAGVEIDKEEAKHHGAEVEPPPTDWIGYILKAFLIAFVVSLAAPLVLIFYIFVIGCVIITSLTD